MTGEPRIPTLAAIRAALSDRGERPARRRGQNFLTDPRLLAEIVDHAELSRGDVVLEVGPGPGTLTATLLGRQVEVLAVEVDRRMITLLEEMIGHPPGLQVIEADILAERPDLPGPVRAALAERARSAGGEYTLVSNLPYQVATTLLIQLLERQPPRRAVVTVQREVAERLAAAPCSREYGAVSVLAQLLSRVELLRRLPPGAFWPRPAVDSAVVTLSPRPRKEALGGLSLRLVSRVVHAVFFARRKRLLNSLALGLSDRIGRQELAALLERNHFEKDRRGEELAPMEILELARFLEEPLRNREREREDS